MKTVWPIVVLIFALCLSACATFSPPEVETGISTMPAQSTEPEYPMFKTTMGDFIILSARLVDEAHGTKAPPGDKFLLLELARPGMEKLVMGEFPLESFRDLVLNGREEIYVLKDDGTKLFFSGMSGWFNEDEFVLGFTVFAPLPETYTLYWTDNAPISLSVEG